MWWHGDDGVDDSPLVGNQREELLLSRSSITAQFLPGSDNLCRAPHWSWFGRPVASGGPVNDSVAQWDIPTWDARRSASRIGRRVVARRDEEGEDVYVDGDANAKADILCDCVATSWAVQFRTREAFSKVETGREDRQHLNAPLMEKTPVQ